MKVSTLKKKNLTKGHIKHKYLYFSIKIFAYLLVFFIPNIVFGQYSISGYLKTEKKDKVIYLSLLRFDEKNSQYENQIITSVKTDSSGFFEIKGVLLSEKDKFYRVYANLSETSLDFVRSDKRKNYHNFIFSNKDSIFFPINNSDFWFSNSYNTNTADKEWQKLIAFESTLKSEFIEPNNSEAISQIKNSFLQKHKTFCKDSIKSPLIKLLAYSNLKQEIGKLDEDYQNNPNFYNGILSNLKNEYGNTSYFLQFREEVTQLSLYQLEKSYNFYRYLSFVLLFIIIFLFFLFFKIIKKNNKILSQNIKSAISSLTKQEQKITELITKSKSNKEIASELFISISTVKTHITNIYSKLEVTSRYQIIEKLKNHTRD